MKLPAPDIWAKRLWEHNAMGYGTGVETREMSIWRHAITRMIDDFGLENVCDPKVSIAHDLMKYTYRVRISYVFRIPNDTLNREMHRYFLIDITDPDILGNVNQGARDASYERVVGRIKKWMAETDLEGQIMEDIKTGLHDLLWAET